MSAVATPETSAPPSRPRGRRRLLAPPLPRRLLLVAAAEDAGALARSLARDGLHIDRATTQKQALACLRERSYHAALIDIELPRQDGLQLLELLRAHSPSCAGLAFTSAPTVAGAVRALQAGAIELLVLPLPPETLCQTVYRRLAAAPQVVLSRLVLAERTPCSFAGLLGATPVMQQLFARLEQAAQRSTPVLITGEPGSGKSLLAAALCQLGPRRGPVVPLYPAVLPSEELMLQLYGQERLGPSGAEIMPGVLERADGGTLLIDQVDQLDAGGQRCLRQLLADPTYCRRGSAELRRAEVRIVAMTSQPLLQKVQRGQFCETLFQLLRPTWLDLPPLRQRRDDIALLAAAFLAENAEACRGRRRELSAAGLLRLVGHAWPGNVRELHNVLGQAAELARGAAIEPADLDRVLGPPRRSELGFQPGTSLAEVQREAILMTLAAVDGNKKRAAALLGLSRGALYSHLRTYHAQAAAAWGAARQRLPAAVPADGEPR
jgi:DNA-binding NtrC family response regulator